MRAAVLAALAVALAPPAGAGMPARDPVGEAIAYARLVEQYKGDADEAIRGIVGWTPGAVVDAIRGVERGGADGGPAAARVRGALPAAVMLHTEAGLYLNRQGASAEAAMQWRYARRLAALAPAGPQQQAFLRGWDHAIGMYLLGSYAVEDAVAILVESHRRFPDDVPITLALAQAHEARGSFSPGGTLSAPEAPSRDALSELRAAEALYRPLIAGEPPLEEARLRLGRVLELMGRSEEALEMLREAAARGEPRQSYLAHLFAGDLLRRRSRLAEAREHLAAAVAASPGAQAAAVGLAEVLHRVGERAAAAATLTGAIEDRGAPTADPFRSYHFGDRAEHRRRLETIKAMARR